MGEGLGYGELPREISLNNIERSFYNMEAKNERIMQGLSARGCYFLCKAVHPHYLFQQVKGGCAIDTENLKII